jgi:hypothetical protein
MPVQRPHHPDPRMHHDIAGFGAPIRQLVAGCHSGRFCSAFGSFMRNHITWRVEYRAVIVIPCMLLHDTCLRFALAEDRELNINAF